MTTTMTVGMMSSTLTAMMSTMMAMTRTTEKRTTMTKSGLTAMSTVMRARVSYGFSSSPFDSIHARDAGAGKRGRKSETLTRKRE